MPNFRNNLVVLTDVLLSFTEKMQGLCESIMDEFDTRNDCRVDILELSTSIAILQYRLEAAEVNFCVKQNSIHRCYLFIPHNI